METLYSSTLSPSSNRSYSRRRKKDRREESKELAEKAKLDKQASELLNSQLEHIKQIEEDNKRKTEVINDLHEHVNGLLQFKEQNHVLKNENKKLKEKLDVKEKDLIQVSMELKDQVDDYKRKENEMEKQTEDILNEKEDLQIKITDLKERLKKLVREVQKGERVKSSLENQVGTLQEEIEEAQLLQKKTESDNKELIDELTGQINAVSRKDEEHRKQLKKMKSEQENLNITLDDKSRNLDTLLTEREEWEKNKYELKKFIKSLQKKLKTVQDKFDVLKSEASKVPNLEKKLEVIPVLKTEYEKAKEQVLEITNLLDDQRVNNEQLSDENKDLHHRTSRLQEHVKEITTNNEDLSLTVEELKKARRVEVETLKKKYRKLQEEYETFFEEKEKERMNLEKDQKLMSLFMEFFSRLLESKGKKTNLSVSRLREELNNKYFISEQFEPLNGAFIQFRKDISEFVSEAEENEKMNYELGKEGENLREELNEKKQKLDEVYMKLQESSQVLQEQQTVIANVHEEKKQIEGEAGELEAKNEVLEEELVKRKRFLSSIFRQLRKKDFSNNNQEDEEKEFDEEEEDDDEEEGSWENFKIQMNDELMNFNLEFKEKENQLESTKNELSKKEEELEEALLSHEEEMKEQKEVFEEWQHEKEKELKELKESSLKEQETLVEEINDLKDEMKKQFDENEEIKEELQMKLNQVNISRKTTISQLNEMKEKNERTLRLMEIVCRAIRPFYERLKEEELRRKSLEMELNKTNELKERILQLFRSLHSEFSSSSFFWKQSSSGFIGRRKNRRRSGRNQDGNIFEEIQSIRDELNRLSEENEVRNLVGEVSLGEDNNEEDVAVPVRLVPSDEIDIENLNELPSITSRDHAIDAFVRIIKCVDSKFMNSPFSSSFQEIKETLERLEKEEKEEDEMVVQCRRTRDDIVKRFEILEEEKSRLLGGGKEFEKEIDRLKHQNNEKEESNTKKGEIIKVMDERIKYLEKELEDFVHPQKFETVQQELKKTVKENQRMKEENDQYKRELEQQLSKLRKYRNDSNRLRESLKEKEDEARQFKENLDERNKSLSKVMNTANQKEEEMKNLRNKKNKYKYMINELNDRYVMNRSSRYLDDDDDDVDDEPKKKEKSFSRSSMRRNPTTTTTSQRRRREEEEDLQNLKEMEEEIEHSFTDLEERKREMDTLEKQLEKDFENVIDDVPTTIKRKSGIRKNVTFSPIVGKKKRITRSFLNSDDRRDKRNRSLLNRSEPPQKRTTGGKKLKGILKNSGKGGRNTSRVVADGGSHLGPLLKDLNESQELVKHLSDVNSKAEKEMKEINTAIQRARKDMNELNLSTEFASPKKSRRRRSYYD